MARVLGVLASGRSDGYTAKLLQSALDAAAQVDGVEVQLAKLGSFRLGPCLSCFKCIRDASHVCVLDDDFGRSGNGALFKLVQEANALVTATPVHNYGVSALAHLFFERLYPFLWSGAINGMTFAAITCATNQGMHKEALREACRFAYTYGLRWIDGVAVHASFYDRALTAVKAVGREVALAARADAVQRAAFTDEERMLHYQSLPWKPLEPTLENLELIDHAWNEQSFKRSKAVELLSRAVGPYRAAVRSYGLMDHTEAVKQLNEALSYWTRATWAEYLERDVVKAEPPKAYRPLKDA